jgi:hypothetical protein
VCIPQKDTSSFHLLRWSFWENGISSPSMVTCKVSRSGVFFGQVCNYASGFQWDSWGRPPWTQEGRAPWASPPAGMGTALLLTRLCPASCRSVV